MDLSKGNLMDELKDVQEDGVVFADYQQYVVDGKCDHEYVKCASDRNSSSDYTRYTGQWKSLMPNGRGTIIVEQRNKDDGKLREVKRYDGMWKNGVICGKGRLIYIDHDNGCRSNCFLIEGEFDEKGHSRTGSRRR